MDYENIYVIANQALNSAKRTLYKAMLPSIWSENGAGWHEQWNNSPNCGLYASCQGLILIKKTEQNRTIFNDVYLKVYVNHLEILFNENVSTADFKQTLQRSKAIGSAYKLAYFLMAANATQSKNEIVKSVANKLLGLLDFDGLFFCSDLKRSKSFLASALAYIALYEYGYSEEIEQTKYNFINLIQNYRNGEDVSKLIFALWAISCTSPSVLSEEVIENAIKNILVNMNGIDPTVFTDKYVLKNGMRDSFGNSSDAHYLFLQTILEYISARSINPQSNMKIIIESILNFSINVKENGMYKNNFSNDITDTLFWENYYVITCLIKFIECCNNIPELKKEKFMIINPKYFSKTEFVVEPKKVVVIMPFSTTWSDDVFHAFCNAIPDFIIWRSLEECGDDAIMQSVWENINACEFVIADCTGKNPNVFYELGIAHTLGKPVFMCAQNVSDIPFDINYIRSCLYTNDLSGLQKLASHLREFAKTFSK